MAEKKAILRKARRRVQKHFEGESRTKQSFKNECDVNFIMKKYEKTGQITHLQRGTPQSGDFSDFVDYQAALEVVHGAQEMFSNLGARVRARFANDPQQFLDFIQNPENRDEAIQLGLIEKPKPPPPAPAAPEPPK